LVPAIPPSGVRVQGSFCLPGSPARRLTLLCPKTILPRRKSRFVHATRLFIIIINNIIIIVGIISDSLGHFSNLFPISVVFTHVPAAIVVCITTL
jgi:hypothetical protein